ncbi:Hypothetical protein R9X50_00004400 [Acrodontium crateriforme]|uniref:F-box domain-containing protein n=1 Tax=Acrodontium crateriforme TaxID=150365 RepID=A0AAQ3R6I2_9PEZI|nr:Hypothetical protein R9X50_00004400 [Acrodontium crateriforme]
MYFETLPTEIITDIFLSLPDIVSVLSLSATSHRNHSIFHSSQRLLILHEAADAQYGPVSDIIQLVTHNSSQPAHINRSVAASDALIRQILHVGRIAQRWADIYPSKKWKTMYADRRLLTANERFLVRRAIYRLWLFSAAFHTRAHSRTTRRVPGIIAERAALLHNYSTPELAEMLDVHTVLRDTVANNICPSNGKIRQKFRKRYPESNHQLLFNIHLNYPPTPSAHLYAQNESWYHQHASSGSKAYTRLQPSRFHEPGAEGWGDEVSHYYVVEDMMKLDPEQVLWLKERCSLKSEVEAYVRERADGYIGAYGSGYESGASEFFNNGETFSETLAFVLRQRGSELEAFKSSIEDCDAGIVVVD